jgi:hypothetical protein
MTTYTPNELSLIDGKPTDIKYLLPISMGGGIYHFI